MIESFLSSSTVIKDLKKSQRILGSALKYSWYEVGFYNWTIFSLISDCMDKTSSPKFSPMKDAFFGDIL